MRIRFLIRIALVLLTLPTIARADERAQRVINYPGASAYCIAVDSNDDVWVTHAYDGFVDKVEANQSTTDGTELVWAPMISGLPTPTLGIAIDSADNVYFAAGDYLYKRTKAACDPPASQTTPPCLKKVVKPLVHGSKSLWPVAVDAADNVYVAGTTQANPDIIDAVWMVTPGGSVTARYWWRTAGAWPHWDLAVDGSGNVFVSEYSSGLAGKVLRITPGGSMTPIQPNVTWIDGIEVDSQGNLWVAGRSVVKVVPAAPLDWSSWEFVDRTPPNYQDASNTWMGPDDDLYIAGVIHGKVWEITDGSPPEYTLLLDDTSEPPHQYGLDVFGDSRGYLYVADQWTNQTVETPADLWRICDNLDTDILCDTQDNCTAVDNASQHDADHDGYGSRCDADFDQNGTAGASDYGTFLSCFGKVVGPGVGPAHDPTCAESDFDANGTVGASDYGTFNALFAHPVGPSGRADCITSPPTDGSCP